MNKEELESIVGFFDMFRNLSDNSMLKPIYQEKFNQVKEDMYNTLNGIGGLYGLRYSLQAVWQEIIEI